MPDPYRLLAAEDARDVRVLLECFLDLPTFQLDLVENGQQALALFKQHAYELVLMDMQMPVMDGYTATREIRSWESDQGQSPVPIIALTAADSPKEVEQCLEAGCSAHIPKPFRKQQLLNAVRAYLDL